MTQELIYSISVPKKIVKYFKILQFLSKSIATKKATKAFQTPITFSRPKREQIMWKSAQKKRVLIKKLNKKIDVLSYGYSKKKVLLVHGWSGRSTQLFMIADKLLEKGYMTISFDATAHGKSEGETSDLLEFIDIIEQLEVEFGSFETAVGHSLGGMALLNAVAKKSLNLKSLATVGSANYISKVTERFTTNLGLQPEIATRIKEWYDKKYEQSIDLFSSVFQAEKITIPTLVVHDSLDGDVPVSCAYEIRQSLQKGSLLITNGFGHTKILRDKNTMNRIVDFIIKDQ